MQKRSKGLKKALCLILAVGLLALPACSPGETSPAAPADDSTAAPAGDTADDSSSGDSAGTADVSGATVEVQFNASGELIDYFNGIVDVFIEESGVNVEVTAPGAEQHESSMKTRMASNDLPDMWTTHGWSVLRYGEYLMPLTDQPWVSRIDEALLPAITDDNGDLYILPLAEGVASMFYNKDIIEQAEIDISAIRTWDDYAAALAQVKEKVPDVTPHLMSCSGGSSFDSYLLEIMWPSYWTNSDLAVNYADDLKGGNFDWDTHATPIYEELARWKDEGYFNVDLMTIDRNGIFQMFANGEGAFAAYSTELIPPVQVYNPDVRIGMFPIPASGDEYLLLQCG